MVLEFGGVSKLYCTSTGELVTLPGQAPDYHICRNLNGDATVVSDVLLVVKPVVELLKSRIEIHGDKVMVRMDADSRWEEVAKMTGLFISKAIDYPVKDRFNYVQLVASCFELRR